MPLTGQYDPGTNRHAADQVAAFEASDGAEANTMRGKPIIVLTSIGAKSGVLRKTPLMRVEHAGSYAVVASKGGAPKEPAWGANLRAHPLVELQDGAVKKDYTAREVEGDERARWWDVAVAAWPDYADYQTKTDRHIAVFVLDPVTV